MFELLKLKKNVYFSNEILRKILYIFIKVVQYLIKIYGINIL